VVVDTGIAFLLLFAYKVAVPAAARAAASQALQVMAISVSVGLCQPALGQQEPSTTRTFGARQQRFQGSTTPSSSREAMRAPPSSWM